MAGFLLALSFVAMRTRNLARSVLFALSQLFARIGGPSTMTNIWRPCGRGLSILGNAVDGKRETKKKRKDTHYVKRCQVRKVHSFEQREEWTLWCFNLSLCRDRVFLQGCLEMLMRISDNGTLVFHDLYWAISSLSK
jgi:hypothetical protein